MTLLAYQDFSLRDARPVVFTGSIASTTDMWLPQLDALASEYRVIAIDHPGHGASPDPVGAPGTATIDGLAADALATLDEAGVGDFDVVGLCLGGAIAQRKRSPHWRDDYAIVGYDSFGRGDDGFEPYEREHHARGGLPGHGRRA